MTRPMRYRILIEIDEGMDYADRRIVHVERRESVQAAVTDDAMVDAVRDRLRLALDYAAGSALAQLALAGEEAHAAEARRSLAAADAGPAVPAGPRPVA